MKGPPLAILLAGCSVCALWTSTIKAEDMLEKETTRFLGWQTSTSEFLTCERNTVKIDTGKVVKTIAKCHGSVFAAQSKIVMVKSVDSESRIFNAVDEKGGPLSIFYPMVAEKSSPMKFEWIKPGQAVDVKYFDGFPTIGGMSVLRAETISEPHKAPR